MTTRGQINSNFYQIVNVDVDGNPTDVKSQYVPLANVANNAIHANIADVANSVAGANVTGYVPLANIANIAIVANSVAVANVVGIGNIATVNLTGSTSNVLYGNGIFAPVTANSALTANYANFAGNAFSVAGANVTGVVANATDAVHANVADSANSVSVANVVGIGNIATVNLDGNVSNILHGNGYWGPESTSLTANYANFAGQVVDATQSNITSIGTLTSLSVTGNITTGNASLGNLVTSNYFSGDGSLLTSLTGINVTGNVGNATHAYISDTANSVSVANVVGIGNIATINLDGNVSNVLAGNGTFIALPTVSANANYANFAGEAFSVSGANVVGEVANAGYATIAGTAYSVDVANVAGIGNIATINLDSNVSNILHGDGSWGPESEALSANYANFAGNVTIGAQPNITSVGNLINLQFNNTVTPITANVGQMFWDTDEHTISLGMENGVTQQIGLETYMYVKADTTITDGQVVMFVSANGNHVIAAPANAASAGFKADYILGIATQDIATNGFGYITVFGKVHGLNTLAYTVGDVLWYDPSSTTGGLTNVQPTDPAVQVEMGVVTKVSGGDGHIQVSQIKIGTLNLLTDVTITTPTTGQALVYNGSNVWINGIPNIANIAYSVSGANVTGTVANATYALTAGSSGSATTAVTVTGNSQPNITSIGTLTSLTSSGLITATGGGIKVGNIQDPSGTNTISLASGQVTMIGNLQVGTGGTGNVTATYFIGNGSQLTNITNISNGNSNVNITTSNGNVQLVAGGNIVANISSNDTRFYKSVKISTGSFLWTQFIADASGTAVAALTSGNISFYNDVEIAGGDLSFASSGNISSSGNLTLLPSGNLNLGANSKVKITGGSSGQVLSTDGLGNLSWSTGGSGSPGGNTTELQFNNAGSFGGISTVTYNGTNISLGSNTTVKITGGAASQVLTTDGTGNLSWTTPSSGGSTGFEQTFLLMGA